MRPLCLLLVLALVSSGCASLQPTTQRVRVVTEPAGARVAVLDDGGRKELGASPLEYERSYPAYRCSKLTWLLPLGTVALGGGAGFGLAYATTKRNDAYDSAWQNGALFGAIGLALGVAVAAECLLKDGTTPSDQSPAHLVVEASQEGFLSASTPLQIPSKVEELRLELPKAPVAEGDAE